MPSKLTTFAVAFVTLIFIVGTVGFMVCENMPPLESIAMSLISISTVGGFVPSSTYGKIFSGLLGIGGLMIIALIIEQVIMVAVNRRLREVLPMHENKVEMGNHLIVCGCGSMTEELLSELRSAGEKFVVVLDSENVAKSLAKDGCDVILGDPSDENVLRNAAIDRAKGIFFISDDDSENIIGIVTARSLRRDVPILAKASKRENIKKMYRIGATKVISPEVDGARLMVKAIRFPFLLELLGSHVIIEGVELGQVLVGEKSPAVGKTLKDLELRERAGALIVAVEKGGKVIPNPPASTQIEANSMLIAIGTRESLEKLQRILS